LLADHGQLFHNPGKGRFADHPGVMVAMVVSYRFAGWPIMIHIPLPLVLTFQIVGCDLPDNRTAGDESGADVGAGPAQSISFDHVSDHPS
jgi:hypothetical protein